MRTRFAKTKRRKIGPWPADAREPSLVAKDATYVGSSEHKDHPSAIGPPALRSDATPCEPAMTRDVDANTAALREGIEKQRTSSTFEGGFPKYVWTWMGDDLYEARHINGPQGTYKAYRLEQAEWPHDPDGCLRRGDP